MDDSNNREKNNWLVEVSRKIIDEGRYIKLKKTKKHLASLYITDLSIPYKFPISFLACSGNFRYDKKSRGL